MSNYKDDLGKTKYPTLYVPFNECTNKTRAIPCRVGMSYCLANSSHARNIEASHVSFPGTTPGASGTMAYFIDSHEIPHVSLHRKILAPSENIGKNIIMHAKLRVGAVSTFKHLFYFCAYSAGGMGLEVSDTRGLRLGVRRGADLGTPDYISAGAGSIPVDAEVQVIWRIKVLEGQMQHRIYVIPASSSLGGPVITRNVDGAPSQLIGPEVGFGYGPDYALDIKDFLAVTVEDDAEADVVMGDIVAWYKSANNQYQLPNFLRQPAPALARQSLGKNPTTYLSWYTLRDTTGDFSIAGMYAFTIRYVLQNSAFDGINLTLGVASFQPSPGNYLTTELREFADWLHGYGLGLRITLIDQSYVTPAEIPDDFPHWQTRPSAGVIRKVITYWDDEHFDVDAEILNNPRWSVYDPTRAKSGTYRWFHHCWTIVDCLKDKPAFKGINIGETSGSPLGTFDTSSASVNIAGVSNSFGIYGITDDDGAYQLDKCFSSRKQRVALAKNMYMIADQLKFRPDVIKSVQTNYFRVAVLGNNMVTYDQVTNLFTARSNTPPYIPQSPMFKNGDAAFLVQPYASATNIGMQADHLYYVRNRSGNTFQLSDTQAGAILQFTGNLPTGTVWMHPICNQIELRENGFRTTTIHNGIPLCDETREMRYLAEDLHRYGYAVSGPDIFTTSLEMPYAYYSGDFENGKTGISPVEIRLDILRGTGWFSDLGPLPAGATIQGQTSTYQNLTNAVLNQIGDLYGSKYEGRLSLAQAYRYAIDRLKCSHIDLYVDGAYPEKPFPNLVDAVTEYKLK